MDDLKSIIGKVATGASLSRDEAASAFDAMMSGEATPSQMGGLLMALRVRGETVDEITGAVSAMRAKMLRVDAPTNAVDVVGTGGDGSGSVNVSTCASFIRDDTPAGVPAAVVTAAFRAAKDGAGQVPVTGGTEVIVFRVTDIVDPAVDAASEAVKKLKESIDRAQTEEQVASYVNKLETDIGTTINQAAFAQVTGANQ